VNTLLLKRIEVTFSSFPMVTGNFPVRKFMFALSVFSSKSDPRAAGIGPLKKFSPNSNSCNIDSSPKAAGMVPEMELLSKSSSPFVYLWDKDETKTSVGAQKDFLEGAMMVRFLGTYAW
jgi:hypothetical protein